LWWPQSVIETLNYETLKDTKLGKKLLEVEDIFVYKNQIIMIQEKGIAKRINTIKEENRIESKIKKIKKEFNSAGYETRDLNLYNIIKSKNGYKICDTGRCKFYKGQCIAI